MSATSKRHHHQGQSTLKGPNPVNASDLKSQQFSVGRHKPTAVYVYTDDGRGPVGAVARFDAGTLDPERKDFRQYRRVGDKWVIGLNGQRLPLYRLPAAVGAIKRGETVWVPEGEKCVEALQAAGIVATTNSGGAEKWQPYHSEALRGADVVVVPDDDAAGRKHAQQVAASCCGIARRIRILDLATVLGRERGEGWDVADWIAEGGTVERLRELAEATLDWAPPSATSVEWPEPVPFLGSAHAEPFPINEALPPELRDVALAIAETVKVDVTAPAAMIAPAISAAVGNSCSIRVSPSYVEPNLSRFVIWRKQSGERGSEMFRRITAPLDAYANEHEVTYQEAARSAAADSTYWRKAAEYAEAQAAKKSGRQSETLREKAREARQSIPPAPVRTVLLIGDSTAESTVRVMAEQGGAIGMFSGDARQVADEFLGRYRRDGRSDVSVYLRAHGGDTIDRSRVGVESKGEYLRIARPSMAMAICVQPDVVDQLAEHQALLVSGFLPRCNIIDPRSLIGTRFEDGTERPMDAVIAGNWNQVLYRLIHLRKRVVQIGPADWDPIELCFDAEAMRLRREFHNEIESQQAPEGPLAGQTGFASKTAGEAARLAGLLHLGLCAYRNELDDETELRSVRAETWQFAERHQRWQLTETFRTLALSREDQHTRSARRVLEWVRRDEGRRSVLEARDLVSGHLTSNTAEAESILAWLEERGWLRKLDLTPGQRKPRRAVHHRVFRDGGAV